MSRRAESSEYRQYGTRTSREIRSTLLALTLEFVYAARQLAGVDRIALLGSLLTDKARPKDVDVLVGIDDGVDLASLARLGRRLKGSAQSRMNAGADVFLANAGGEYLGRVCHYRECHRRVLCHARNCGAVAHLSDDLDIVRLDPATIAAPPVQLHPTVLARVGVPTDVERLLLTPLARAAESEPGPARGAAAI